MTDPIADLEHRPMTIRQIAVVGMCVLLNAMDGFDVLSISFASPGIASQWGIDRAALGVVLSMELIGMAVGSVLIGRLCDQRGRRPTTLLCLTIMAVGMALTAFAQNIPVLAACRTLTGVGVGGMLAATSAIAVEWSNRQRRNLAITLTASGYPLGAVIGGTFVSAFVLDHGWRGVFLVGAAASFACLPLVWLLVPETVPWLVRRRPAGALERANRALSMMGRRPLDTLPQEGGKDLARSWSDLVRAGFGRSTTLLTLAYFAHIMTFYFILKWVPKIVADMGFPPSAAGSVLVAANLGGLAGALLLSLLTTRWPSRRLTIVAMLLAAVSVAGFGHAGPDLANLRWLAAAAGFCTNAGVVGLYAIIAQAFPADLRATGTGIVIGIGRGGAALSPIVAGLLFANGLSLSLVALVMAAGAAIAAAILRAQNNPTAVGETVRDKPSTVAVR